MQYWQNGESSSFFLNRTSNGAMGCYTPSTLSRRTWALILISFSYTFTVELLKEKSRCEQADIERTLAALLEEWVEAEEAMDKGDP